MASPHPPHLEAALAHLKQLFTTVQASDLDLKTAAWGEIEKAVARGLGGPFVEARPEHQAIALGVCAVLASRLMEAHSAFWFPNREAPEGATLGFSEALILLSPYAAVIDALSKAQLGLLEETQTQIRQAIGQAKFAPQSASAGPTRLTPADYQRLFDPGFVQLVLLDLEKAKRAWNSEPTALARDVRDALARVGDELPPQAKSQLENQLVGALSRLEPGKSLITQADNAPRLIEMFGHLIGTAEFTGAAPEEFWQDVVFPLLFIGVPERFPPTGKDEQEAIEAGADLLALWVDTVPYRFPAPEDGLMGAFDADSIKVPAPELAQSSVPRILEVDPAPLRAALTAFDPQALQQGLQRFGEAIGKQVGKVPQMSPETAQMLEASLALIAELRRMAEGVEPGKSALCVRRITEAEAASELTLSVFRKAFNGPKLILASR